MAENKDSRIVIGRVHLLYQCLELVIPTRRVISAAPIVGSSSQIGSDLVASTFQVGNQGSKISGGIDRRPLVIVSDVINSLKKL